MTEGLLDFMGYDPQQLRLTTDIGDAAARWLKTRHPTHTAKLIARDIGCDVRTAENILLGHLSGRTITRLLNVYGWQLLSGVGAAVIGETYETSIHRELEEIANERRALDDQEQRLRGSWARVRARGSVDGGRLRLVAEEDPDAGREARREDRSLGA